MAAVAIAASVAFWFGNIAIKHGEIDHSYVMGSDVILDGMFVEVSEQPDGAKAILEIFFSDVSYDMVVTFFRPSIPLEGVE